MKDDSGPAFPEIRTEDEGWPQSYGGMSLRDWFAGMALQALKVDPYSPEAMALAVYVLADAILAARKEDI